MSERLPTNITSTSVSASDLSANCRVKTGVGSTGIEDTEVSIFKCAIEDSLITLVPTDTSLIAEYDPVNVYGSKGFVALYSVQMTEGSRPLWKQCDNVVYCDGPEIEEQPNDVWYDRYEYRWKFVYDSTHFFYNRVGNEPIQASLVLFPTAYTCTRFSVAFDQTARPLYACELNGTIEIRRIEAGVLNVRSFTGTCPVLFLNALLQQDTSQQDVVCYYLRGGSLYGRWQRDEFLVEYLLVENLQANDLRSVRADRRSAYPFERLFVMQDCATRFLRSDIYAFWAVLLQDLATITIALNNDGDYVPMIILTEASDSSSCSFSLSNDGLYLSTIADIFAPSDNASTSFVLSNNGVYALVVVAISTMSDSASSTLTLSSDGVYTLVIELVGTYTDAATTSFSLNNDGDYYT